MPAIALLACTAPDGLEPEGMETATQAVLREATRPHGGAPPASARARFERDLVGLWRTKVFEQGAWVDLIWVVGRHRAWHAVTAYADEQLTVPLLRWDLVRHLELEQPSSQFPAAYDLTWTDLGSSLLAHVDNDALFTQVGVADCDLVPGVRRDVSTDNCGAPLFPFRDCPLADFVELADGLMTFGDPRQGDRCVQRPTQREAWSFERVPLTFELLLRLFGD